MIKKIILTREANKNKKWQTYFIQNGFEVEQVPLIETRPRNISFTSMQLEAEWIFFTSANAVTYFFARQNVIQPYKYAVIGEQTSEKLAEYGFSPSFIPSAYQTEIFLAEWLNRYPEKTSVLLPKSNLSRTIIEETLNEKGYFVFPVELYETIVPTASRLELITIFARDEKQIIIFASPSAWKSFYAVAKNFPNQKENWRIASIGNVTTKAIVTDGWDVTYQAETFTMKHLADLIIQEEYK
ncbi:uroporphyrinogen-III synthase [Listeria ivanovii]|uniref:Uroporphyrinogen-III synthase n=3 Tax=Listeria ivanovii TaxID=1638 RepID=A0ABS1G4X2_LISIV|nr:uroporphyrinogen-III synthase [Listeria ivanovii]AIS59961.1 uroporphyrinogen-III synthase [Listeria ivanovii subsp. londoniensis]MBK1961924.1 uroporphyrinogen-III synthase [Listeria ivanovii subsp. londoniensis]PZG34714.1 uroporphyrinogen-III synthase [Listeria ivanovii]PZG50008.1 uroporphyrinogen-III synthase [Listeria ivanovii]PZH12733.1 uroporphyrinogen-III synthase [Listeria ivanovii]